MPGPADFNDKRGEGPKMARVDMTAEQTEAFAKTIKAGIYKELHRRKLLTDTQLNDLLSRKLRSV